MQQHNDLLETYKKLDQAKVNKRIEAKKLKKELVRDLSTKQHQKIQTKYDKVVVEFDKTCKDMRNCCEIANRIRNNVYNVEVKKSLQLAESYITEWTNIIKGVFELSTEVDVELISNTTKSNEAIQNSLQSFDNTTDLNEFITTCYGKHQVNDLVINEDDMVLDNDSPTSSTPVPVDDSLFKQQKTKQFSWFSN